MSDNGSWTLYREIEEARQNWLHWCNVEKDNKKINSDLPEEHEEHLDEMARKERFERGPLMDHRLAIPDFIRKYR